MQLDTTNKDDYVIAVGLNGPDSSDSLHTKRTFTGLLRRYANCHHGDVRNRPINRDEVCKKVHCAQTHYYTHAMWAAERLSAAYVRQGVLAKHLKLVVHAASTARRNVLYGNKRCRRELDEALKALRSFEEEHWEEIEDALDKADWR